MASFQKAAPDYLLIGHIAHDETPQGPKLGGTVSYAGGAADAMGAHVAIVTSAQKGEVVLSSLPPRARIQLVEAPESTVFVNRYVGDVRHQLMTHRAAAPLTLSHIPAAWRNYPVVHLGPLDDEVDPDLASAFPGAFVGATPQGWMRAWDDKGVVRPKRWEYAEQLLPILSATVFSEEDIGRDTELEAYYAGLANLLVITRASKGCTVYQKGQMPLHLPAPKEDVADATGAGDVFAGVFFVLLYRTDSVRYAAEIATQLASISVTRVGLDGIPTQSEIAQVITSSQPGHQTGTQA